MKSITAFMLAFFLLNVANVQSSESGINLKEIKCIYTGNDNSEPVKLAAGDLIAGFKLLYGSRLTIVDKAPAAETPAIILGNAALDTGVISSGEIKQASPGGYVIKAAGSWIAIAGAAPWSVRYGAGRLLEYSGCRYADTYQFSIAAAPLQKIETLQIIDKPVFDYRNGFSAFLGEMFTELSDPRKGANPELFDPKKTGSDLWIDHTAGYLVPKLLYYDQHPEYYAMMKNGKRIDKSGFTDHRTPLCLSNPDVTALSAERLLKLIANQPDKTFFFVTNGDTNLWCQCTECRKLDPEEGAYATRNLLWVNNVAKIVAKKYPDKVLLTFAYAGSDKAPVNVKPESNVRVILATGMGNIPFYDHAKKQGENIFSKSQEKLAGWIKLCATRPLVCEYIGGCYQPAFIDQTASRYRDYASSGIGGIVFSYGNPLNFIKLWNFLHGKLLWNPDQDAMKITEDFVGVYYGPAGNGILKYLKLMHEQYLKTLESGSKLINYYPPDFYSADYIRNSVACFEEAAGAVKNNALLSNEIEQEKMLFLQDAFSHLGRYNLDKDNQELVSYILDETAKAAGIIGKSIDFRRDIDLKARTLAANESNPGLLAFVREKIGERSDYTPEAINNGLRISPVAFTGADYGPQDFNAGMSHKTLSCPPKLCAGVFAAAKDSRGNPTSTEMKISFKLNSIPGNGSATLELEGQDAVSKWGADRQLNLISYMQIAVNGKEIFKGECGFVRGNWSRRTFDIPAGTLNAGRNEITVKNTTSQTYGPFSACWVLVSDIKLLFKNN